MNGWFKGTLQNRIGIVAGNYIKVIDQLPPTADPKNGSDQAKQPKKAK